MKQKNTDKRKLGRRMREAGNVFFMLFGAVAMVGVIGASTMTIMKGPVRTMSVVTKRTIAENNMIATGKLALIATASQTVNDCDNDGTIEPIPFSTTISGFTGGGEVPATIGAASEDPWGMKYGYCAWDHGSTVDDGACGGGAGMLDGNAAENGYILAIVSAGPDGVYQTDCNDDPATLLDKPSGSDDLILGYTYAEAGSVAAGLWNLKSGDPDTAEIQKKLEVSDGTDAQFQFDAAAQTLTIGDTTGIGNIPSMNTDFISTLNNTAVDILSPVTSGSDITTTADVNADNVTVSSALTAGSLATGGTLSVTGTSTLGVVNAGVTSVSTLDSSGLATLSSLDVTNNAAVGGTLGVTGTSTLAAVNAGATSTTTLSSSGLATLESLSVTNNAAVSGGFAVTGTSNLAVTNVSTLGSSGLATLDSLAVTNDASVGGTLDMTSGLISNLLDPVSDQDATTRKFVLDNIAAGTGYTESDPQVDTLTSSKWCTANAGGTAIDCTSDLPGETDPQVGDVSTSGQYCRTDGTTIQCDQTATDITSSGDIDIDGLTDAKKDTTNNNLFLAHEGGAAGDNNSGNIGVGIGALDALDNDAGANLGDYNVALGYNALTSNTTGWRNTAVGGLTLYNNTTAYQNMAIGFGALQANTTGYRNTASGAYALYSNTIGTHNAAYGTGALYHNTTASYNTALGRAAGQVIADGSTPNTTTGYSLFLGASTKALADGDTNEIVIGYDATGAGSNSVVLGNDSITKTLLKGAVAIGSTGASTGGDQDLELDVTGDVGADNYCDADGNNCFASSAVSGGLVDAIDDLSDAAKDTTNNNLFLAHEGGAAGDNNDYNTAIGINALDALDNSATQTYHGDYNTALGYNVLTNNTTGYNNTASGINSLVSNTTGYNNTASGINSLYSNTTGYYNTATGVNALLSNTTGYYNTANGVNALYSNTTGVYNTASGYAALYANTIGNKNTASGMYAGRYIADGSTANETTGNSVFIGYNTKASADGVSNENVFGYDATGAGSNSVVLGNDSITKTLLKGAVAIGSTGASTGGDQDLELDVTGDIGADNYCDADGNNCFASSAVSGGLVEGLDDLSDAVHDTTDNNIFIGHEGGAAGDNNVGNLAIGTRALDALDNDAGASLGDYNIALGHDTLTDNTTGWRNTAVGATALNNSTTAYQNTAVGFGALQHNTTAYQNTASGAYALYDNTTGLRNSAYGRGALYTNTTGNFNTAQGYSAGRYIADGSTANETTSNSVFIGYNTKASADGVTNENVIGYDATGAGSNSVVLGNDSITKTLLKGAVAIGSTGASTGGTQDLELDVTGDIGADNYCDADGNNCFASSAVSGGLVDAIDDLSDAAKDTTNNNMFIGHEGGSAGDNNDGNLAIGIGALDALDNSAAQVFHGNNNTALGHAALTANTTGYYNTANGYASLASNTAGYYNTATGMNALYANTTGYYNTANGVNALLSNTTGYYNTANGVNALYSNKAKSGSTAIGYEAMRYADDTTTASNAYNTALGYQALRGSGTAADNTGTLNVAVGSIALYSNTTGSYNAATGHGTLYYNTTGNNNTGDGYAALHKNTTGYQNAAVGTRALYGNTTGYNNIALGMNAGRFIADSSTLSETTSNSVFLGAGAKALADGDTNEIVIGYDATGAGSNSVVLGNDSITKTLLKGDIGIGTTAPEAALDVAGTDSILFPRGTTAQQPGSPVNGMMRYNSDNDKFEAYQGGSWQDIITNGSGGMAIDDLSDAAKDTTNNNMFLAHEGGSAGDNNDFNTAIGIGALDALDNDGTQTYFGDHNTALGHNALTSNTYGYQNVAVGKSSLNANISGQGNAAFGVYSLFSSNTASYNTAVGGHSLYFTTTGGSNTAVGRTALYYNTTGASNIAMGWNAGRYIADGTTANETTSSSVFLGASTKALADGDANEIVIGYDATGAGSNSVVLGNDSITKTLLKGNVGIGVGTPTTALHVSGKIRMDSSDDTWIPNAIWRLSAEPALAISDYNGVQIGGYNGTSYGPRMRVRGTGEVGIGDMSPDGTLLLDVEGQVGATEYCDEDGANCFAASTVAGGLVDAIDDLSDAKKDTTNNNLFLSHEGGSAGDNNDGNLAIGIGALTSLDNSAAQTYHGDYNTALGHSALASNTTGYYNTAVGNITLFYNTTGSYNTANGRGALYSNTTGNQNTATGVNSLYDNTTGYNNTASGINALRFNTTGYNNTASGGNALYSNTTGYNNTANGVNTLYSNTTGYYNTANGVSALYSNTSGTNNTVSGLQALYSNTTGSSNAAIGVNALYSNTTGSSNTASGRAALFSNTTGSSNTASGYQAGQYIADGSTANATTNSSVYIGYNTKASADGVSNENVFGYDATGAGTNSVVLGNDSVTKTVLKGDVGIGTETPSSFLNIYAESNGYDGSGFRQIALSNDNPASLDVNIGSVSSNDGYIGFDTYYGSSYQYIPQGTQAAGLIYTTGTLNLVNDQGLTSGTLYTPTPRISILSSGKVGVGTTTPEAALDVAGTDSILFPRGTTAQQPGSPVNGMMRYNSDNDKFEAYQGGSWQDIITNGSGGMAIDDLSDAAHDTTDNNIFIGHEGGSAGDNNDYNTAIGIGALDALDNDATAGAGDSNTALGYYALSANTTGTSNTAIGINTLISNTSGIRNIAVGPNTLSANTTGNQNVALGFAALYTNKAKSGNTAVGEQAMYYADDTTTASNSYNTAIGYHALRGSSTASANTAVQNTATGYAALLNSTSGGYNTASGSAALYRNTTGSGNAVVGHAGMYENTTGYYNVAMGTHAGRYIADGSTANQTTNSSVFLGYSAKALADGDTNEIVIGYNATGAGSNSVVLGNDSITKTLLKGDVGIGTDSPTVPFDVVTTGSVAVASFSTDGNGSIEIKRTGTSPSTGTLSASTGKTFSVGAENTLILSADALGANANSAMKFLIDGGESMRVTSAGALVIGDTTASSGAQTLELDVAGDVGADNYCDADGNNCFTAASVGAASGLDDLSDAAHDTTDNNIFIGHEGGSAGDNNDFNLAIGIGALDALDNDATANAGDWNTALGYQALTFNTTGYANTATGYNALFANTTGSYNVANGQATLQNNSTGAYNAATGAIALHANTTGNYNAAKGYGALYANTTGSYNLALGGMALWSNTAKSGSTAIGYEAMRYADDTTTASDTYNVALGYRALRGSTTAADNTGTENTAIGASALVNNTTGNRNTAVGYTALGLNTTGTSNAAVGRSALGYNTTGYSNAAVGVYSLLNNTTGRNNAAVGYAALYEMTTGYTNAALGAQAGRYIADGSTANETTNTSIFLGGSTKASADGVNNEVVIGYGATGAGSNSVVLGNDSITTTVLKGNVGINSTAPDVDLDILSSDTEAILRLTSSTGMRGRIQQGGGHLHIAGEDNQNIAVGYDNGTGDFQYYGGGTTALVHFDNTGDVIIGATAASGTLLLDVEGQIGATEYCDENGANCTLASALGGGAIDDLSDAKKDTTNNNLFLSHEGGSAGDNNDYNTAIGIGALDALDNSAAQTYHGDGNTAVGYEALTANTTGYYNVALGRQALSGNTTGSQNTALGQNALRANLAGSNNVGVGLQALYYNTSGSNNVATGLNSLLGNTTGSSNSAYGMSSLVSNTTGSNNISVGTSSLYSNKAKSGSTAVGVEAMRYADDTTTASNAYNTALGYQALRGSTTAGDNTGIENTAIGVRVLLNNTTGSYNTANGGSALSANTTGYSNTAVGNSSLYSNTTGLRNAAVGMYAGRYIADGSTANETTSNSVFIGYNTKASADGVTNENVFGYDATGAGSNSVVLGNDSITKTVLKGNVGIGTDAPSAGLHVDGSLATDIFKLTTVGGGNWSLRNYIHGVSNDGFSLYDLTNSASRFVVNQTGEVGIGDTTPDASLLLDVEGQVGATEYCDEDGANCFTAASVGAASGLDDLSDAAHDTTDNNIFIGHEGGSAGDNNDYNLAIGIGALDALDNSAAQTYHGNFNTAIGYNVLTANTTGYYNTAFGGEALKTNTTGSQNTGLGKNTLNTNQTGSNNTAVGLQALYYNTTGSNNVAVGVNSLISNTIAQTNTAIGNSALYSNKAKSGNTAVGYIAMYYADNTTTASNSYNTALGYRALRGSATAGDNTGVNNTAVGTDALLNNASGSHNAASGANALGTNTTGDSNAASGYAALYLNTTGTQNTAAGSNAGRWIADGSTANETTDTSIFVGANTKASADGVNNEVVIGYDATGAGSNSVVLGNDSITKTVLKGNVGIGDVAPSNLLTIDQGNVTNDFALMIKNVGAGTSAIGIDHAGAGYMNLFGTSAGRYTSYFANGGGHTQYIAGSVGGFADGAFRYQTDANAAGVFDSVMRLKAGASQDLLSLQQSDATEVAKINYSGGAYFAGATSIGTTTVSTGGDQDLELDVAGDIGADNYCDADGNNCFAASTVSGGLVDAIDDLSDAAKDTTNTNLFLAHDGGSAGDNNDGNLAIGIGALDALDNDATANAGDYNTAVGHSALTNNTTGFSNTASGLNALRSNTSGYYNTSSGYQSLYSNTTGYENTSSGKNSLYGNTTGYRNTGTGMNSLYDNTTGYNNTATGVSALYTNKAKSGNTAVGFEAMRYADDTTTASDTYNVALGYRALRGSTTAADNTGTQNTAIGASTLINNTTGERNTAVGYTALGANTTGTSNAAVGRSALGYNTTGYSNAAVGVYSLMHNTTGRNNSVIGYASLYGITTGYANVAIGNSAGRYIADGSTANQTTRTSVFLGGSTKASADGVNNEVVIGYDATGAGSNSVVLGNDSVTLTLLKGDVAIGKTSADQALDVVGNIQHSGVIIDASDRRLKTDITPLNAQDMTTRLAQVETVSFRMKDDPSGQIEFGVIAQDVEALFPELVITGDDEMKTKHVNYIGFITPLIEANKTLQAENEALKIAMADKDQRLNAIEARMNMLDADIKTMTGDDDVTKASMEILVALLALILSGFMIVTIRKKQGVQ